MKLAIFDAYRLGVVSADEQSVVDVTSALPSGYDPDPLGAGWWVRLCRDWPALRERVDAAARSGEQRSLASVRLLPPVLNPSKIVAAASNYSAHKVEMHAVSARTGMQNPGEGHLPTWLGEFDIFLKAPSSISGPVDAFRLPRQMVDAHKEVHHESELVVVIGRGGKDIAEADALRHVFGYTIGLDMTLREQGDRSRRKSYDTFTPLGPWVVTADEVRGPPRPAHPARGRRHPAPERQLWRHGDEDPADHRLRVRHHAARARRRHHDRGAARGGAGAGRRRDGRLHHPHRPHVHPGRGRLSGQYLRARPLIMYQRTYS